MAKRFWVGNGGSWLSTTHWSATSGGASGASVPLESDEVVFDANSITIAAQTISIDTATANCAALDMSAVTNSPTLALSNTRLLNITGYTYIPATVTYTDANGLGGLRLFGGDVFIAPTVKGIDIRSTRGSGSVRLMRDLTLTGELDVLNATLDTNEFDINAGGFDMNTGSILIAENSSLICSNTVEFQGEVSSMFETVTLNGNGGVNELSDHTYNYFYVQATGAFLGTASLNGNPTIHNLIHSGDLEVSILQDAQIDYFESAGDSAIYIAQVASVSILYLHGDSELMTASDLYIKKIIIANGGSVFINPGTVLRIEELEITSTSAALTQIRSTTPSTRGMLQVLKGAINFHNITLTDINLEGNAIFYKGTDVTAVRVTGLTNATKPTLASVLTPYVRVYSSSDVFIDAFDVLASDVKLTEVANTADKAWEIAINAPPDNDLEDNVVKIYNAIEYWVRTPEYPDGYIRAAGYIDSYKNDYENEKIIINVRSYGKLLSSTVYEVPPTSFYRETSLSFTWYKLTTVNPGGAYNGYVYDRFTTGVSTTNVSHIAMKFRAGTYYDIGRQITLELFGSTADAQSLTAVPLASATVTLISMYDRYYIFAFSSPLAVTASTAYYARIKISPGSGYAEINHVLSAVGFTYVYDNLTSTWSTDADKLNMIVYSSTGVTTRSYTDTDLSVILQDAIDSQVLQGGKITYSTYTIPKTGVTATIQFNSVTISEIIESCHAIAGDDFVWYIDDATRELYFKEIDYSTVDHRLTMGKDIIGYSTKKSLETALNTVYFTGGEVSAGVNLYKKYQEAGNKAAQAGLPIAVQIVNPDVIDATTAEMASESYLAIGSGASLNDRITIASSVVSPSGYPVESISLGDMIYVQNAGTKELPRLGIFRLDVSRLDYDLSDIGTQLSPVRQIEYTPESIQILRGRINKGVEDVTREITEKLSKLMNRDNPSTPN